jgi:hypothetical protein
MIEASPALTPNSRATCGNSGSATRMVATEANDAALKSTIGRTIEGSRMASHVASRAGRADLSARFKLSGRIQLGWPPGPLTATTRGQSAGCLRPAVASGSDRT